MSNYKTMKQIVLNGKVYMEATAIMDTFCAICSSEFRRWRADGMPYVVVKYKKQIKYFYNIVDCQRWFSGDKFPAPIILEKESIELLKGVINIEAWEKAN